MSNLRASKVNLLYEQMVQVLYVQEMEISSHTYSENKKQKGNIEDVHLFSISRFMTMRGLEIVTGQGKIFPPWNGIIIRLDMYQTSTALVLYHLSNMSYDLGLDIIVISYCLQNCWTFYV
jgi:hypothetical protein